MGRSSLRGWKFKAHPGLKLPGELRRGRRTRQSKTRGSRGRRNFVMNGTENGNNYCGI